jgi:hypothetical protein
VRALPLAAGINEGGHYFRYFLVFLFFLVSYYRYSKPQKEAFLSKLFKMKVLKWTKLGHQKKFQPNRSVHARARARTRLKTCARGPFLIKRGISEKTVQNKSLKVDKVRPPKYFFFFFF